MSDAVEVLTQEQIDALFAENERLQVALLALKKIDKHAEDGQNGSVAYAFDRLTQIRKVVAVFLQRLPQG